MTRAASAPRSQPYGSLFSFSLIVLFISALPSFITAQQLIPSNLPACAQQCTVLQQGQTGCVPAGGAPVTSSGIYQSCFCQSALLTQLYGSGPVQLCSTCSAADMLTIQNWYKNFCGKGGAPLPGGNASPTTTVTTPTAGSVTTSTLGAGSQATSGATTNNLSANQKHTPWISTHYKWVIMLIVGAIGLVAIAVGGYFLHRHYHDRRQSQWSTAPSSQPDINTWGPGQSVHDLRYGAGAPAPAMSSTSYGTPEMSSNYGSEKGKGRMGASTLTLPSRAAGLNEKDKRRNRRSSGGMF